ncbi:MAG: TetR/AcrR family transcriptional regulator [Chitinophagales bacterium]
MKNLVQIDERCIPSKIFEKARLLFNQMGVRNTTMDDLAKELGISKKTLYQEIKNKADLVRFCILYDLQKDEAVIRAISENTENAIEEWILISDHVNNELQQYHPALLREVTKFYPESWELIHHHINSFAKDNIKNNLIKGIKQGYYRKDIDIEMVSSLQLHLSMLPIEQNHTLSSRPDEIHREIIKYNLHAIATPEGIKLFEKLNKSRKINL